jgi:hypothetical protein
MANKSRVDTPSLAWARPHRINAHGAGFVRRSGGIWHEKAASTKMQMRIGITASSPGTVRRPRQCACPCSWSGG